MNTSKELKGNIGEWSEIYAFCHLLRTGILKAADRNLNSPSASYLPIIRVIRSDETGELSYYPKIRERMVEIYRGQSLTDCIPIEDFDKAAKAIYSTIAAGSEKGIIKISEIQQFLTRIHIMKLKADATHKEDIRIQLHDVITNQDTLQNFSIKSYIGGDPTLLNAARTTNFRYLVEGCNDAIMEETNAIETRSKIFDKISFLRNNGCKLVFDSLEEIQFQDNLRMIDYLLPNIVAEIIKIHYSTGLTKLSDIVKKMYKTDPFGVGIGGYYEYKVKSMLRAIALGMVPSQPWVGNEDANGGYVVVKDTGDIVCFFSYDKVEFEQYLIDYTKLERASTSRHNYASVYKQNGDYFIDLNLQIRFINPESLPVEKCGVITIDSFIG